MDEWRKNTPSDEIGRQMEKMMADMAAWTERHKASLVDAGYPLGKTKTVSKDGAHDGRNDLNYACVVEADSHEAAAAIFSDNPHVSIPNATIDVMEIPHRGM